MGQLFYESKQGNYSRRDIDKAIEHFKRSDQAGKDGFVKVVIPEHMKDKARAIQKEFRDVQVVVGPVSMIHINDDRQAI
jgi:hypothetical protein